MQRKRAGVLGSAPLSLSFSSAKRGDLTEDRVPSHDNENGGGGLDQPPSLFSSLPSYSDVLPHLSILHEGNFSTVSSECALIIIEIGPPKALA